jgi:hypothetical protein
MERRMDRALTGERYSRCDLGATVEYGMAVFREEGMV